MKFLIVLYVVYYTYRMYKVKKWKLSLFSNSLSGKDFIEPETWENGSEGIADNEGTRGFVASHKHRWPRNLEGKNETEGTEIR